MMSRSEFTYPNIKGNSDLNLIMLFYFYVSNLDLVTS